MAIAAAVVGVMALIWAVVAHRSGRSFANVLLGCKEVEGVLDSGFHYQEYDQGQPFRWTNGHGKLLVPIDPKRSPQSLWVSVMTFRPKPDPIPFRIVVDGKVLYDGMIPSGKWEIDLDLRSRHFGKEVMIELLSSTFVPKGVMDGGKNNDPRTLGVQVRGLMLKRNNR
ncbi:hypothetical protein [Thermopirellula anaerolimosa]